ncbi:F-box/LRR-repeat protein 7-like [Onthophagus taurus]|uniref:F-box/LRR-repeat protein 7-like n=1 Tax=Onthophagus taurus TaxID=166361 RepID=UPI000C20A781|nr:F-box/LRR-repeat protein 7-like [Onthophagus taurus]
MNKNSSSRMPSAMSVLRNPLKSTSPSSNYNITSTWYHNLPIPILVKIFRYFTQLELKSLMLVCIQWKYAAQHPDLWKSLTIRGNDVPINFICKKIRSWTKLESVRADDILEPATVIRQVCRCIPGIKHLAIRHCTPGTVPESAIRFVIKSCPRLESLDLSGTQIKGTTFYKELSSLTHLKKLNLSDNPHLGAKDLITAVLNCRKLNDLRVSKYVCKSEVLKDDDAVLIFLSTCDRLISLAFDCATFSVSTFGVVFNCRKLERLALFSATKLVGEQFASIWQQFPRLKVLKITNAYQINDIHVMELFEDGERVMKKLTVLDLSGCWKITEGSLDIIANVARNLEKLSLKSCKSITSLESVSKYLLQLKMLNMAFMKSLRLITAFPLPRKLKKLYIDENDEILGWLKSLEDNHSFEVKICLSEYNKNIKDAEL